MVRGSPIAAVFVGALFALPLCSTRFAQSETALNREPVRPGAVRLTTRAPEPEKWAAQHDKKTGRTVYNCKPLACADKSRVTFATSRSPTRHPDPQALEKFAKVDLPKQIEASNAAREILSDGTEKIETLVSKTDKIKDYPAVINETKYSRGKSSVFIGTAMIFAGPVLIRIQSVSPDRTVAKKSLDDFINAMEITEGPPLPPGTPVSPAKPLQSL